MSSFGDVILTTPVLTQLREKYPNSTIDFIVLDSFKEAIRGNKNIDNLIIFEKNKIRFSEIGKIQLANLYKLFQDYIRPYSRILLIQTTSF